MPDFIILAGGGYCGITTLVYLAFIVITIWTNSSINDSFLPDISGFSKEWS
jgi:hypothetical protein